MLTHRPDELALPRRARQRSAGRRRQPPHGHRGIPRRSHHLGLRRTSPHTAITSRPLPLGHVIGHDHVEVSDEHEPVGNDDYAGFGVEFSTGSGFLQVSRIAAGHPNSLGFEVFCANGSAWNFDFHSPGTDHPQPQL